MGSQEVLRKYSPSSRMVLRGCAAASIEEPCSSRTTAEFTFEWAMVRSEMYLLSSYSAVVNLDSVPLFVLR